MPQLKNVYDFTDLLHLAESENVCNWNTATRLFKNEKFLDFTSSSRKVVSYDDIEEYCTNETVIYLLKRFFEINNITDYVNFIND